MYASDENETSATATEEALETSDGEAYAWKRNKECFFSKESKDSTA